MNDSEEFFDSQDSYDDYEEIDLNKENTRKTTKKIRRRRLSPLGKVLLGAAFVGTIGGTLLYFDIDNNTPHFTVPATSIVSSVSANTTFDEILSFTEVDEAQDLDDLQKMLDLSETLHGLRLDKYTEGLNKYEIPEVMKLEDLDVLITEFCDLRDSGKVGKNSLSEDDRKFTKICLILEAQERAINSSLSQDAYNTLVAYALPLSKSKVLDACGFAAAEVSCVKLQQSSNGDLFISFTDPETGKPYTIITKDESRLNSEGYGTTVFKSIIEWQTQAKSKVESGSSYNQERNKKLQEGIDTLKAYTLMEAELVKDKLVIKTPMKDVRAKGKELIKTNEE